MVLYEIAVKNIEVILEVPRKFWVKLEWETRQSDDRGCTGPFFLLMYEKEKFCGAYPITLIEGKRDVGIVEEPEVSPDRELWVKVGVTREPLDAVLYPAALLRVDFPPLLSRVEIQDQNITVWYQLWDRLECQNNLRVWFEISGKDQEVYRTEQFLPIKTGEEFCQSFSIPEEIYQILESCCLTICYDLGDFQYRDRGKWNCVPLEVPRAEMTALESGEILITWTGVERADAFSVMAEGLQPQITRRREWRIPLDAAAEKKIAVAALYGAELIQGPYGICAKNMNLLLRMNMNGISYGRNRK